MSRAALTQLGELIDAAEQTQNFITGVVQLDDGKLGGEVEEGQTWLARKLEGARSFPFSALFLRQYVAKGLAGEYGPEQLRKGAAEARRMVAAIAVLRDFEDADVVALVARLDELDVSAMPDELATVSVRSPELRAVYRRLIRARAVMAESRTRLVLRAGRAEN